MTDLASEVAAILDEDDLLSPLERVPAIAKAPAEPKVRLALGREKKAESTPAPKTPAKATPKPKPTPPAKRRPVGERLGSTLEKLAQLVVMIEPAGGRALVFAAPAIGMQADQAVAGTWADRKLVQPVVGVTSRWAGFAAALGLPLGVMTLARAPQLYPLMEDELKEALSICVLEKVRQRRARREKDRKLAQALAEVGELDPSLAASEDPLGELLRFLVFGPEEETPHE